MSLMKLLQMYSTEESTDIVYVSTFDSPVGKIIAVADDQFLFMVSFEDSKNFEKKLQALSQEHNCKFVPKKNNILNKLEQELCCYFRGELKKFTVPIKTFGSDFQKEVWAKLLEIPYGSTQTYGELAKAMGRAASHSRAVGAACGANAHLLVIPCHRLVASGSKGGFSSGVDRKEWLLNHEKNKSVCTTDTSNNCHNHNT